MNISICFKHLCDRLGPVTASHCAPEYITATEAYTTSLIANFIFSTASISHVIALNILELS